MDLTWSKSYTNRSYNFIFYFYKTQEWSKHNIGGGGGIWPKAKKTKYKDDMYTVNITESHGRQEKLCLNEK